MSSRRAVLHLVRHAESLWNVEERYQGQADSGLTPEGHEQARALGRWLFEMIPTVDIVAASDLPRARDTAGPLAATLAMDTIIDSRLREVDVGSWSGRTFDEIATVEPETVAAAASGKDVPRGGGETFATARERVVASLNDLAARALLLSAHPVVVVFTSGGPIRVASADALGIPSPGHSRFGPPANCSVTTLEHDGPIRRLLHYNRPTVVGVPATRGDRQAELAGLM